LGCHCRIRIVLLILLLLAVSAFINIESTSTQNLPETTLSKYLQDFDRWKYVNDILLPRYAVKALDLDDFLNRIYKSEDNHVNLYIGYYYSNKKIGAAHSPLVCFPGQGWDYSSKKNLSVQAGNDTLNIAAIYIAKGNEKQLVLYWFQAYDKTSSNTFMQKIHLYLSGLLYSRENNAFVRIMVPIDEDMNEEKAVQEGLDFIRSFYPHFKNYLTSS